MVPFYQGQQRKSDNGVKLMGLGRGPSNRFMDGKPDWCQKLSPASVLNLMDQDHQ
jgi:hypothetical protein